MFCETCGSDTLERFYCYCKCGRWVCQSCQLEQRDRLERQAKIAKEAARRVTL